MLLSTPLPFVENFINELDKGLKIYEPKLGLSRIQRGWLGFIVDVSSGQVILGADATSWGRNSPQAT